MQVSKWIALSIVVGACSNVSLLLAAEGEQRNVQQVPQKETYQGRVTGETPSSDPGGVRGTAPPKPGPGERQDSVTVTPPGHRTPGASPGTVTAAEPRGAFGEADKNRSGFIEEDEARDVQGLDFMQADADRAGRLSLSEFEAATGEGAGAETAEKSGEGSGSEAGAGSESSGSGSSAR